VGIALHAQISLPQMNAKNANIKKQRSPQTTTVTTRLDRGVQENHINALNYQIPSP
jgi:hypothetical protein